MGYSDSGCRFSIRRSSRLLGTSAFCAPERGSLFGLRRSPRLRSKSPMTMSPSPEMASRKRGKPRNPKPKSQPFEFQPGEIIFRGGYLAIPKYLRDQRKIDANYFRCAYRRSRTPSDGWDKIIEKRFIVVSGREHVFPNVGRSHGIMWVGVHGIDSICAVFLNKEPDMQCIMDWLGGSFASYFMKYVLSEMEDVADSPRYSDKTGGKPFAVVSLPDYSNADEESFLEASAASVNAQGAAIDLLEQELNRDSSYTKREIELIAISAFQRLCGKEFEAEDIVVCGFCEEDNEYEIWKLSTSKKNRRLASINQL